MYQPQLLPPHEKGSRQLPANYRPVSLTCIVSKIMESFGRDALVAHLQDNGLFAKEQHGFVQGRSCTTQLLSALEMWTSTIDDGNRLDAVFLAFDTFPHQIMLRKLHGYDIDSYLHTWIESFLVDRKQCAMTNGARSSWKKVASGMPQGSLLGPILFVAYVNDLPESVASDVRFSQMTQKSTV